MRKKRVCMFFNDLAVYRKAIYKMLDEEYDCEWYIENAKNDIKSFDQSELKNVKWLSIKNFGPLYVTKGLLKLLKKDFDVYFFSGSTRNFSLFIFCIIKTLFFRQKRIYFWTHGFYGKESRLAIALWKRPLFKLPDGLFVYSEYAKNLMVKEGFDGCKIYPIYNSLDYDKQLALRNSIHSSTIYFDHFGNAFPVLIMIGRLNLRKHLDMLIEAMTILIRRGNNINAVLIGEGEDRHKLEQLAFDNGISNNIWFYGSCFDETVNAELLYNSDICVVPGDIGLTAIHSLMFGVPAITHNCFKYQGPEFAAIQPGVTGDFYEYGSINSLAETISKWLQNQNSNRDSIREACYEEIDKYWNPYNQMDIIRKHLI